MARTTLLALFTLRTGLTVLAILSTGVMIDMGRNTATRWTWQEIDQAV